MNVPEPICHIVAAGPGEGLALHVGGGDLVIAADGGYRHCVAAGVTPDVFIGDFDSLSRHELVACEGMQRIELPCEKDDTDTLAAVREGLSRGYRRFEVHAALGGDVGHELANMQTLLFAREQGAWGVLHGQGQDVYVIVPPDEEAALDVGRGTRVGVFAFAGTARGVVERGLVWELEDACLEPGFPLGASNCATTETVCIGVREGALLVVVG